MNPKLASLGKDQQYVLLTFRFPSTMIKCTAFSANTFFFRQHKQIALFVINPNVFML